jgi:hypothetical protein
MFTNEIDIENLNIKPLYYTFKFIDNFWEKNCIFKKPLIFIYNDIGEL